MKIKNISSLFLFMMLSCQPTPKSTSAKINASASSSNNRKDSMNSYAATSRPSIPVQSLAEDRLVSLDVKNMHLDTLAKIINAQTQVRFIYGGDFIHNKITYSLDCHEDKLSHVMTTLFPPGSGVSFIFMEDAVVLSHD